MIKSEYVKHLLAEPITEADWRDWTRIFLEGVVVLYPDKVDSN